MKVLLAQADAAVQASPMASATPGAAASSWLASPLPSSLPIATGPDLNVWPYFIQLVLVTAVVGALGYFALKLLRDRVPSLGLGLNASRQIRVVDKVVVDPKRLVFLVGVGDRYWLLASTDERITTLAELTKADLEGGKGGTAAFADLVENERRTGEAP